MHCFVGHHDAFCHISTGIWGVLGLVSGKRGAIRFSWYPLLCFRSVCGARILSSFLCEVGYLILGYILGKAANTHHSYAQTDKTRTHFDMTHV